MKKHSYFNQRQQGFTLLEALIAFVVLAGGLLAAFRFHSTTVESTAASKVRAEAISLAELKIEQLRSYLTTDDFDANTVGGSGMGDYAGVNYAANFTQNWSVAGDNPRELTVTVNWVDQHNNPQDVALSTLIWRTDPPSAATQFTVALSDDEPGGGGWNAPDPVNQGTGEGVGKIIVDPIYDGYGQYAEATAPSTYYYYNVYFSGSINATDDGLEGVAITGTPNSGAESCVVSGDITSPVPVAIDDNGDWLDVNGVVIPNPYIYTCHIYGIPDGQTWTGTVTYDPAGNDAVCIPDSGSVNLSFSQQSPAQLQLGVVVLTNNGACN